MGGGLVDSIVAVIGINICRRHSVGRAGVFSQDIRRAIGVKIVLTKLKL